MANILNPYLGQEIHLVDREQLRFKRHGRTFGVPDFLKSAQQLPDPPVTFDASRGRTIKYPILGNNQVGDCYLTDALHCIQSFIGNAGLAVPTFNVQEVINRYYQLSGGDNGLSDGQIFPAWTDGLLGPHGPHKILDEISVDPRDDKKIKQGMYLFCGASWTTAMFAEWVQNAAPGYVWDSSNAGGGIVGGHAMHLSGYGQNYYHTETWGIDPCVQVTPNGLRYADPEITLQFSLEMFRPDGIAPHNGMSYDALAGYWLAAGGKQLPPNPFTNIPPATYTPPFFLYIGAANTGLIVGYPDVSTATTSGQIIADMQQAAVIVKDSLGVVVTILPPTPPPHPLPQSITFTIPGQQCVRDGFGSFHTQDVTITLPLGSASIGQGATFTIPPGLLRILRFICPFAGAIPPPYGPIVQLLCAMLPPAQASDRPCGGCW